ncbi:MAG: tryptophan-rich sensory protein [Cryobacterium sp.]
MNGATLSRDVLRQGTVLLSAALALVGAFIGSGAAGGTPIQNASGGALAADATLIAPGGPAFSIWTPIYLGLIGYALWQALPGQRTDARQRQLGYPVAASLLLNAAWILSVQFDLLVLSVPVIVALLLVLLRAFRRTLASRPKNRVEAVLADATLGLYLGWVCVATAANVTAVLVAAGFRGWGVNADLWAVVVLGAAGAVGVVLAVSSGGRIAPALALGWGLGWVAVARFTGPLFSMPAAVTAAAMVLLIGVATVVIRARARSGAGPGRSAR